MADRISIDVVLKSEQLKKMMDELGRMAGAGPGAAVGAAGAAGGGRGGIGGAVGSAMMGEEGKRTEMMGKGLGQIAKQLPGAGVLGDMAGAFKSGGIVGVGMAGIAGILGFVKQIVESSKVFQGIAGSFFKIFGAMADVFLLPFLPLAMRGMQALLKHMPMVAEWGEKAAQWVEKLIKNIGGVGFWNAIWVEIGPTIVNNLAKYIPGIDERKVIGEPGAQRVVLKTEEDLAREADIKQRQQKRGTWGQHIKGQGGGPLSDTIRTIVNLAIAADNERKSMTGGEQTEWRLRDLRQAPDKGFMWVGADSKVSSPEHLQQVPIPKQQLGGFVHGGPGEGVPTMLHGGEIVIPRSNVQSLKGINSGVLDILAGTDGQLQALEADINNYWMESKRDRQDPQSDFMKFKLEVIGEDLPNTLSTVGGWYRNLGVMANNIANQTKGFGAGWTAAGKAAYEKYGVKPWTPSEGDDDDLLGRGGGDGDNNTYFAARKRAEEKYGVDAVDVTKERKTEEPRFGGGDGAGDGNLITTGSGQFRDTASAPNFAALNPLAESIISGSGLSKEQQNEIREAYMNSGDENDIFTDALARSAPNIRSANYQGGPLAGVWDVVEASNQTEKQKREMYEMIMSSGAADENATIPRQTALQNLERVIDRAKSGGLMLENLYNVNQGGMDEPEARSAAQVQADFDAAAATRRLQLKKIEDARIAESLKKSREAIYGPEGGVDPETGDFIHGGLIDPATGRMKTLEQIQAEHGVTQATFHMTKLEAPEATAAPRVDAETKALEDMIAAQVRKINSYDPRIAEAWRWADAGGEGGPGQQLRGFKAQSLIREQSQQEELLTRMWNQHAQDRLPYSMQEFQTRFSEGMAAGGIVPGDIGEPQMVMAHGGETVSPVGMTGGRRGHTSNRVMNISINNASSVRDILRDLNDMESMDDASFFNSVS